MCYLEIGKWYRQFYVVKDKPPVYIAGAVEEGTIEYLLGARFYTGDEHFYTSDGRLVKMPYSEPMAAYSSLQYMLIDAEVPAPVFYKNRFRATEDHATWWMKHEVVPLGEDLLMLGLAYVNRMRNVVLLDRGYPTGEDRTTMWSRFKPDRRYSRDGHAYLGGMGTELSMHDLVGEYTAIR